MRWSSGDAVVIREVWNGQVWRANACRVVRDDRDSFVLWFPPGSEVKFPARTDGTEIRIPCDEWALADRRSHREMIGHFRWDARHSVWTIRNGEGSLAFWYVNLDRVIGRNPVGFDYWDEKLDIVIEPDGTWRWKDEDELAEAARLGIVDADEVWAEARRVIADPPWPTGWEDWRPDPSWTIPDLPDGWDAP